MPETQDVTAPVLAAVSKLGCFWRQNQGLFLTMDGRRHVRATSVDGIADIVGVYKSVAIAIETKTKKGKLATSQRIFRKNFNDAGGIYIVARCPEDALEALKTL